MPYEFILQFIKTHRMIPEESKKVYFFLADNINEGYAKLNEALQQDAQQVQLTLVQDYEQLITFLEEGLLPDVILLDTELPYKTFFENLASINEDNFTSLPVIIFHDDYQPTLEACYNAGCDIFLMNPGSFKQLTSIVRKIHEKLNVRKSTKAGNNLVNEGDAELAEVA
jgi:CheY-like chemotaxis protein